MPLPTPARRRFPLCSGHILPRSTASHGSGRTATFHVAASLPLLVCATALSGGPAHAQEPGPPTAPARDSARLAPAPGGAPPDSTGARPGTAGGARADSGSIPPVVPPLPPGSGPADSARARARADSTCVRRNDAVPLACVLAAVRGDSASARAAFLAAGRKLLEHAQRSDRTAREPRNSGEYFRAAFGPAALLRAGAVAGVEHLLGRPGWLPRTRAAYALRFGMRLGMGALATGIRYETGRWLGLRSAPFEPCGCQGTGARLAHALAAPFRAETTTGSRFSPLTPLTELSSGMVFATVRGGVHPRQGLEAGLTGMLSLSMVAVLREFRPWEKWSGH